MSSDLAKQFDFFDLDDDASLEAVDHKYWDATNSLHATRRSNPDEAKIKQATVDEHYLALLKYFMRGMRPVYVPAVTYEDVALHRQLPPPVPPYGQQPLQLQPPSRSRTPRPMIHPPPTPRLKALQLYQNYLEASDTLREACRSTDKIEQTDADKETDNPYDKPRYTGWHLEYKPGDIFKDIPDQSVIVHSCNCMGVWGKGFAEELKKHLPGAYDIYANHCKFADWNNIVGSCLLIRPQPQDFQRPGPGPDAPRRYVACLFTSFGYGRPRAGNPGKASEVEILNFTDCAIDSLKEVLDDIDEGSGPNSISDVPGDLFSPKINAGHFGVPWIKTRIMIVNNFQGSKRSWTVFDQPASSKSESVTDDE